MMRAAETRQSHDMALAVYGSARRHPAHGARALGGIMADLFSTFAIAASGMDAQSRRMRHVAENIANADTPGYRRKTIDFTAQIDHAREASPRWPPGRSSWTRASCRASTIPSHALADATGITAAPPSHDDRNGRCPRSRAQLRSQSGNVRPGAADVAGPARSAAPLNKENPTHANSLFPRHQRL